ncbi:hypothetical protein [Halorussus salinisoli]|uniref:hypothetical protein n=1 Tax=Halorussus salinisoli TaxID=2558242 RepID=UPI0010C1A161|nr:hypothetical protein [Halorussus salinisoli]
MTRKRTGLATTEPVGSDRRSFLKHLGVAAPLGYLSRQAKATKQDTGAPGHPQTLAEATRSEIDICTLHLQDEAGNGPLFADETKLYERFAGNPVDTGVAPAELDGEHVTWEEFSAVEGSIVAKCVDQGRYISMHLQNLVPLGLYTVWIDLFEEPGFVAGTHDIDEALAHEIGVGAVGPNDGSQSTFRATETGEAMYTGITPPGELSIAGEVGACALPRTSVRTGYRRRIQTRRREPRTRARA